MYSYFFATIPIIVRLAVFGLLLLSLLSDSLNVCPDQLTCAAVTFLKGCLATITRVQYTSRLFHTQKLRDITIYWRKAGIAVVLSSATGNRLDETWHKSALKLNLECFCSRDKNQIRNICDRVSLYSDHFSFAVPFDITEEIQNFSQPRTNNLLIEVIK